MHWVGGGGVKSKTSQVLCEFTCVNVVVFLLFLFLCYYCTAKKASYSYMSVYVSVKQLSLFLIKFSGIGIELLYKSQLG